MITSFTDLRVWQEGHGVVLSIHDACSRFPKEELHGLTSQLKRASASIASNIAEGFGRSSTKVNKHFWIIADGSCYEVKNQLIIAKDLQFITKLEYKELLHKANSTYKLLYGLLRPHNV